MDQNHDDIESANLDLTGKPVETVVSDEKKEDVTTDIKTIALGMQLKDNLMPMLSGHYNFIFLIVIDTDSLHLSDHPLEKSVLEDNDFIHSCSGKLYVEQTALCTAYLIFAGYLIYQNVIFL